MTKEEMEKYNEGYLNATQVITSYILKQIDEHPTWMPDSTRKKAKLEITINVKNLLQKKGLIPSRYDIIRGKAKEIQINFNKL